MQHRVQSDQNESSFVMATSDDNNTAQEKIDELKEAMQTETRAKVQAQLKNFTAAIQRLDKVRRRAVAAQEGARGRISKLPPVDALQKEYDALLKSGTAKHEIAGKLGARFRVTARAVRLKLKKGEAN